MVEAAFAKTSPVDGAFWEEIVELRQLSAWREGSLVGLAAFGVRKDGTGTIPWLHGGEDPQIVNLLLDEVTRLLAGVPSIDAFQHASALAVGLEGLPIAHRPITHSALGERGFVGEDLWLYMRGPMSPAEPVTALVNELRGDDRGTGPSWELTLRERRRVLGEATVGIGAEGLGVLWWIDVEPRARGRGFGRVLLRQARTVLANAGAREMIVFVDHDAPGDPDRDRRPAIGLYHSEGFVDVDHLFSYELNRQHGPAARERHSRGEPHTAES